MRRSIGAPPLRADLALPRVSVVVPTHQRPALLRRCLRALLKQSIGAAAYEVIVVDDGRQDSVRDLVRETAAQQPHAPPLRYLRPHGHGSACARNLGWRAARAPLVAFTDDDTIAHPDWLAHGEVAMRSRPHWSGLAGRVLVPLEGGPRRPSDHERMAQGLQRAEFVTANAFVRRGALARVGGFDERFLRARREDADLQFRLMRDAGPLGRCEAARVLHPVRREPWGVCLRQQRNTYFDALLYKKHPRLYRQRIRRVPPWDDYAIVAATLAAALGALLGAPLAAGVAAVAAIALMLRLAWQRLRPTRHDPAHVLEVLATSALIPFLSVYWRARGALHFRVLFL